MWVSGDIFKMTQRKAQLLTYEQRITLVALMTEETAILDKKLPYQRKNERDNAESHRQGGGNEIKQPING